MLTHLCRSAIACAGLMLMPIASEELKPQLETLLGKSQAWLLAQQQDNGSFVAGAKFSIGITAMAVDCLASPPNALAKDDPRITRAIAFLLANQQPDGGFYAIDHGLGCYGTALTLMALSQAGGGSPEQIRRAQEYLFGIQNTESGALAESGIGYGSKGRGHEDVINTGTAVEGLIRSGVPSSDPRLQKALEFFERCQVLDSSATYVWEDTRYGGAKYSPEPSNPGGNWPTALKPGDPRPEIMPYGSVTYQLISSYVALDLKPGDPRLDAALDWVKRNYRFDANPGMPAGTAQERQGLFYYYMAMAKTFDLLDQGLITLPGGRKVDWRADLFQAIKANATESVLPDGTAVVVWMNAADRWAEGIPHVTTGYLLKALKRIHRTL